VSPLSQPTVGTEIILFDPDKKEEKPAPESSDSEADKSNESE